MKDESGSDYPELADRTCDELVSMLFDAQEAKDPDSDPGDLSISIQDDMPLVVISQKNQNVGFGQTLHGALMDVIRREVHGVKSFNPFNQFG